MGENKKKDIKEIEKRLDLLRAEKEQLLQEASEIKGSYLSAYEIRPAGRHLFTIGENLIQDPYAAIVELVKNSYDADSPDVIVSFCKRYNEDCLEICVEDHGHGMTTEDVINKWLVPSTSYKQEARISPRGRIMQGRKGIGRYAASILGDSLRLETVDKSGNETTLCIQWSQLAQYQYLDQVQIPIKVNETPRKSGTRLVMISRISKNEYWTDDAFRKLRFELKKLVPPKLDRINEKDFKIILEIHHFYPDEKEDIKEIIEPYPILEFYDYRISGHISCDGSGKLLFENQKVKNISTEKILCQFGNTQCGSLDIDIRVYDREKEAIDQLIYRGLRDEEGNYVTKLQARQLLNMVNGIGVYRNGFRIRPLGDADYDWLKLNEKRIQNPSMKIGSNQVIGYIHIQSEEKSGLEEKSARDGLKDNVAYEGLKKIVNLVIAEIEQRRYIFRRRQGLSNSSKKLGQQLDDLYDYSSLKQTISQRLKKAGLSMLVVDEITGIITKEEQKNNSTVEEIKRAVAVYQGQATLGKIVNVVLHEGRRPLNYIKNQIPNLAFYGEQFQEKKDSDSYNEIVRLTNGIANKTTVFVDLFERLDSLSAKRREKKNKFILHEAISGAIAIFEKVCFDNKIDVTLDCSEEILFVGWKQDIYTIIVNLLDNSIFWMIEKKCKKRKIDIRVSKTDLGFILDYTDSGPGISDELLESGVIFEPEFTTKPEGKGTGLGLAIAGEAAMRNNLILTAVHYDNGAHFILSNNE